MSNNIVFFSVHADDVRRRSSSTEPSSAGDSSPGGRRGSSWSPRAIKTTREFKARCRSAHEVVPGKPLFGYECTIAVDDIDAAAAAVEANGGTIIFPKCEIPTVGWLDQDPGPGRQYPVREATGARACRGVGIWPG